MPQPITPVPFPPIHPLLPTHQDPKPYNPTPTPAGPPIVPPKNPNPGPHTPEPSKATIIQIWMKK